jgi:ATP-dependent Clp protease ATP-binding subunit ClpB
MNRLQGEGEFEKASIIKYKIIPNLEKNLEIANKKLKSKANFLVKEIVNDEEIANIVSR